MASDGDGFSIRHIDHLVLVAEDARALVAFYQAVLALPLERSVDGGLYQLRAGDSLIDIVSADASFLHGAPGVAASIISACASSPSMQRGSGRGWPGTASTAARSSASTAPRASGRRSTSRTRKATRWN